jgi:hypothetical protein
MPRPRRSGAMYSLWIKIASGPTTNLPARIDYSEQDRATRQVRNHRGHARLDRSVAPPSATSASSWRMRWRSPRRWKSNKLGRLHGRPIAGLGPTAAKVRNEPSADKKQPSDVRIILGAKLVRVQLYEALPHCSADGSLPRRGRGVEQKKVPQPAHHPTPWPVATSKAPVLRSPSAA